MKRIKPFRGLDEDFMQALLRSKLKFILQFERKYRKSFMVEIRNNFLDLYFLGHTVELRKKKNSKYSLIASDQFNPRELLPSSLKPIVKCYGPKKWEIDFSDIKKYKQFEKVMSLTLSKIVAHKKGKISEGVSELNHFIDNRSIGKNGVLVVDRQVVYPGIKDSRIDLLGLHRLKNNGDKFTFSIIELKNKNNTEIGKVFSQTRRYVDLIYRSRKTYEDFKVTYEKVLEQKIRLRLLKRIKCNIAHWDELSKKDIEGLVILDNFNIKSDLKDNGLLSRALKDWARINKQYNIKLFLKTNVLDSTFFMNRFKTQKLLNYYKKCNS